MVVTLENVPRGKPAPAAYLEAARRLGAAPARCLAVDDADDGNAAALALACKPSPSATAASSRPPPPTPRELSVPRNPDDQLARPQSVLAVFAHPDDAELWAGGTLALHAQHAPVHIAVPLHDPVRDAEAQAGAAVLGAALHQLPELTPTAIRALLIELTPHVVITHPVHDTHTAHRRTAEAVLEALPEAKIETGRPRRLYTCDTYNSLTLIGQVTPTVMVDVTATFATKMQALHCHKSQPIDQHFGPMAEDLARLWGRRSGADFAEAFTALPVLGRVPGAAHL